MEMKILAQLGSYGVVPLTILLGIVLLVIVELGCRVGTRRRDSDTGDGSGLIVGSILALTAFVLALTLNASTLRLTERRMAALDEANAIGTAWLQARALGPQGDALAALIRDYAEARLAFSAAGQWSDEIASATEETSELQTAIWTGIQGAVAARADPVTASLMNATNTMFDSSAAARFADENGLPPTMVRLMLALAVSGMFALGWQLGMAGRAHRLLGGVLAFLWAATIVHILDMGTPRIGRFGIDTSPYEWTLESMGGPPG